MDELDVQRDQLKLVDGAMRLLAPGGVLYFSNNLRSFTLDERLLADYAVRDISAQSVPEDFRQQENSPVLAHYPPRLMLPLAVTLSWPQIDHCGQLDRKDAARRMGAA